RSDRLAGITALASREPGFMAALFDAHAGSDAQLGTANGYVLQAALENGTSPKAIVDRVLGLARVGSGQTEPTLEIWQASETSYLDAFAKAAGALPSADARAAVVAFAKVISPRNTVAAVAPGPAAQNATAIVARILAMLDRVSAAER